MTNEVFDQEKTKPKYEVYDVNTLYPEPVDVDEYLDWQEQRYGIKFPGLNASVEELDAYYDEIDRRNSEEDTAWKTRPFIEKFFFAIGMLFVPLVIIAYLVEDTIDRIKDKWSDRKERRGN